MENQTLLLKSPKTNWKYIIIIVILAVMVGFGTWIYNQKVCLDCIGGPPIKPPEKKVIISTDKTEYELGETVVITIQNNSSIINFIDYPIIENLIGNEWVPIKGSIIWAGCWVPGGLVYLPLDPNTLNSYQWDQKEKWCSLDSKDLNTYSKEVSLGTYRVKSRVITRTKSEAEDPNNISGQPAETVYSNEFKIKDNIETADWKTYRNDDLGMIFRYPKEWKMEECVSESSDNPFHLCGLYVAPVSLRLVEKGESSYTLGENCCKDDSSTMLCEKIESSLQKEACLQDAFQCETCGGIPGGAIGRCEFLRVLTIATNNDKYPVFEATKVFPLEEKKELLCGCSQNHAACMEGVYDSWKEENKTELETFDKFLKTIQIY